MIPAAGHQGDEKESDQEVVGHDETVGFGERREVGVARVASAALRRYLLLFRQVHPVHGVDVLQEISRPEDEYPVDEKSHGLVAVVGDGVEYVNTAR